MALEAISCKRCHVLSFYWAVVNLTDTTFHVFIKSVPLVKCLSVHRYCKSCLTGGLGLCFLQLARHNKILQNLLKPPKKSKEGEEGISSMVNSPSLLYLHRFTFIHLFIYKFFIIQSFLYISTKPWIHSWQSISLISHSIIMPPCNYVCEAFFQLYCGTDLSFSVNSST